MWPWRKRDRVGELLRDAPRPAWPDGARRRFARWLRPVREEAPDRTERLGELVRTGERLARLRDYPEWAELVALKEQLQAVATETSRRRPLASEPADADRIRPLAAAEYWAIETLFASISRVITKGEQARGLLKENNG